MCNLASLSLEVSTQLFFLPSYCFLVWCFSGGFFFVDNDLFQYSQVLEIFFFSSILIRSWFRSSILTGVLLFPFFVLHMIDFSIQNSFLISWLYIRIVCIRISRSFFFLFLPNILISSIYIRRVVVVVIIMIIIIIIIIIISLKS